MLILARTGGRRETDQIEMFPLPLPDKDTGAYVTHCLLRRVRYMQSTVEEIFPVYNATSPCSPFGTCRTNWIRPPSPSAQRLRFPGYLPAYLTRDLWQLNNLCPTLSRVFVERVNLPPAGVHHRLLCRVEGPAGRRVHPV